jgi:hypothetical protein
MWSKEEADIVRSGNPQLVAILYEGARPEDLSSDSRDTLQKDSPELPNYENFPKVTNCSGLFISLLVKYLLHVNSHGSKEHFVDSTDVPVCKNHNI